MKLPFIMKNYQMASKFEKTAEFERQKDDIVFPLDPPSPLVV
jgi:hypothetical protein